MEIKNVTLAESSLAMFPDAQTTRGQKHLRDLMYVKNLGFEACLIFLVQRSDCREFTAAKDIDAKYAELLSMSKDQGVIIRALCAHVDSHGVSLSHEIPCIF